MAYRIETTHDPDRGGWLAEIYDDAGELAACPLEVWRTTDGRVLLHWPMRGEPQLWLELDAQGQAWLREELAQ